MSGFEGKVVLVTGAGSGIGAATGRRLRAAGAMVYEADLEPPPPGPDRSDHRLALDVREEAAWIAAVEDILRRHHRLDVLVNSAGVSAASPLPEMSWAEWRQVLATNLDGAFLATKHGIRAMRPAGGVIIHVGSASGTRPPIGAAAYATSKAALRMLVQAAAKESRAAGWNIRINLVSPAGVKTPLWRTMPFFRDLIAQQGSEAAAYAAMEKAGGGAFLEPDVVAGVVCWLASDEAAHLTGVDVPVDDGYIL